MLREELGRKANCPPESVKIIVAGKILKAEEEGEVGNGSSSGNAYGKSKMCLRELGVKNNSRVMASKIQKEQVKALQEEVREAMSEDERARRLARIRESASSMAERNIDDSLEDGDYSIEMENLDGKKVKIGTDADQRFSIPSSIEESSALAVDKKKGSTSSTKKGDRPVCDFCNRSGHTREKCRKLHRKPADWKPRNQPDTEKRGNSASTEISPSSTEPIGNQFSQEDFALLHQMLRGVKNSSSASVAQKGGRLEEDDWQC